MFLSIALSLATLLPSRTGPAGDSPPRQTGEQAAPKPAPVLPNIDSVRVMRVWVSGNPAARTDSSAIALTDSVTARMGQLLMVRVRYLDSLVRRAACLAADGRVVADCTAKPLLLFLAGRQVPGLAPEAIISQSGDRFGVAQFHLQRTPASDETWADLLGGPKWSELFLRPTDVSIGIEGASPVRSSVEGRAFHFERVDSLKFRFWSVVFLLAIVGFIWYSAHSDLLRDVGHKPLGQGQEKPYSLGRCQMAWWFILVVGGFSFIFLVTGSWQTITGATLGLLGISATTFLGSAAIDADHISGSDRTLTELTSRRAELKAEAEQLQKQLGGTGVSSESQVAAQNQLVQNKGEQDSIERQIPAAEMAAVPPASRGFLRDVLGDGEGQSFHRLQMAVWSIVLGVLFVNQVWHRLAMPEFDGTLLGLLGISSGTYLGFKFPERNT